MTTKRKLPQAVIDYLKDIGANGGRAVTGKPKEEAGRIGGLKSGQARRLKKLQTANSSH